MSHFFRRIGAFFRSLWAELTQKKKLYKPSDEDKLTIFKNLEKKISRVKAQVLILKLNNLLTLANLFSQSSFEKSLEEVKSVIKPTLLKVSILDSCDEKELAWMLENIITTFINRVIVQKDLILVRAALFSVTPELANSTATEIKKIQAEQGILTKLKGYTANSVENTIPETISKVAKKTKKLFNPSLSEESKVHLRKAVENLGGSAQGNRKDVKAVVGFGPAECGMRR